MSRSRRLSPIAPAVLLATLAAACGSPSEPGGPEGVRVVAGAGITDTVQARPLQALVVEVRDDRGEPRPGVVVRFESVRAGDPSQSQFPPLGYGAYVSRSWTRGRAS